VKSPPEIHFERLALNELNHRAPEASGFPWYKNLMNAIKSTIARKLPLLALLPMIVAWFAGLRSVLPATQAQSLSPIWGTKPVLSYFVLTPSLFESMRSSLNLTEPQVVAVRQAAVREADQLQALQQSTLPIVQDQDLSLAEKRARIASSGYNQQVLDIQASTQTQLQSRLDAVTYNRLVDWIEQHWLLERDLHGVDAIQQTTGTRTYSIYTTRFDTDSYIVALPDKCLKLANGGYHTCDDSGYSTGENYSVRLKYKNTTTAKVGDSGPWNADDNYWSDLGDPQPDRLFPDLPLGMPEAQAAYFDDYNNGEDQFGRTVTAPFGIDLNRQVSIDIGLDPGVNDWVEVEYLWTDGWEDIQSQVVLLKSPSDLTPAYTGDMCVTAWHRITGYDDHAYLTLNVDDPGLSTNRAEWRPKIPASGEYQVLAFIPDHPPIEWQCPAQTISKDTGDAGYTIEHAKGKSKVSGNQGPLSNMWIDLGTYKFNQGTGGVVKLTDLTDEASYTRTVAFSAMLFRNLDYPDPTPQPTPTQIPTPTPTPVPFVWAGDGIAVPSTTITIPLGASHLISPSLVAATIDIQYDPDLLSAVSCQADPQSLFESRDCDANFEQDGVNPDIVRLTLRSTSGVSGSPFLAQLSFSVTGDPGQTTPITPLLAVFQAADGTPIEAQAYGSLVCIAPCRSFSFLPALLRALTLPP
jgi:hypothetical protein